MKMTSGTPDRPILLYPLNGGEWVGHYYHYLFGYLLPTALYTQHNTGQTCVLSVGYLDHITRDIFGDDISIVPITSSDQSRIVATRNLLSSALGIVPFRNHVRRLLLRTFLSRLLNAHDFEAIKILNAYDHPVRLTADLLTNFRSDVLDRLAGKLDRLNAVQDHRDVVVIERGKPGEQFVAMGQTAGKQRRSIPNIDSLCRRLGQTCGVGQHCLEDMEFAAQVALFSGARVVVAQHGAALANILWMRPGSLVVEVIPPRNAPDMLQKEFFSSIARQMGVNHHYILQHGDHADLTEPQLVEIEDLVARHLESAQ